MIRSFTSGIQSECGRFRAGLLLLLTLLISACVGSAGANKSTLPDSSVGIDQECLNGPGRTVPAFVPRAEYGEAEEAFRAELNTWIQSERFRGMAPDVCVVGLSFEPDGSGGLVLVVNVTGNPDDALATVRAGAPYGVSLSVRGQPRQMPLQQVPYEPEFPSSEAGAPD